MKGLWIVIGEEFFIIPVYFVEKVIRSRDAEIINEKGREYFLYQGRYLPLVDPLEVFAWGERSEPSPFILVIRLQDTSYGLYIDSFEREDDVLVRSAGPLLEGKKFISGVVVGEAGMPYIILDPYQLKSTVRTEIRVSAPEEGVSFSEVLEKEVVRVLLVEDSPTTLRFEKDVLEDAGFQVVTATNGREAWEKFQNDEFNVVVTDIQMPEMDGLELTKKIKSSDRAVPVMVVSSLGSEEDVRRGMEAGADAYMIKKDFVSTTLIEKVRGLIG